MAVGSAVVESLAVVGAGARVVWAVAVAVAAVVMLAGEGAEVDREVAGSAVVGAAVVAGGETVAAKGWVWAWAGVRSVARRQRVAGGVAGVVLVLSGAVGSVAAAVTVAVTAAMAAIEAAAAGTVAAGERRSARCEHSGHLGRECRW